MRNLMTAFDTQEIPAKGHASEAQLEALQAMLQEAVTQLSALSARVSALEQPAASRPQIQEPTILAQPVATSSVATAAGITEEEFLAVSAALAAYLGVHAHIRQIRLIRSGGWAQQGRVTIQTSHRLSY
jgi:methylmalonyl-CoA carboxyltransferase large subunit